MFTPGRVTTALVFALCGCARESSPNPQSGSPEIGYETFVSGLAVPWDLGFLPDGRMLVTERPGRVRVIEGDRLREAPWATLDVVARGEAGLMGIAISPHFATDRFVYVVGTFQVEGRLVNRVVRLTDENGFGSAPTVLIDHLPAAEFHAGDAIDFGLDGTLYVATGDAGNPRAASNLTALAGKVLRYRPDGTIPGDNPSPNSPVYALGLRNVQGLTWHPESGRLFAPDHGPSGFPNERFRRNNDELNLIGAGQNYGWPDVTGFERDDRYVLPLATWNPAIAPSGIAIYNGPVAAWRHHAFVGGLRGQQLRRLVLEETREPPGYRVIRQDALFAEQLGRIRAVSMGPDGYLYFTTSNWDGRGTPRPGDDRILRLRPASPNPPF
ncbi:MAG: PQQ-dependent sugar dehydrogenase [Longimicrobiales bacterium]